MKRISILSAVGLAIALAAPVSCSAQQSSLFGSSSGGRSAGGQSGSSGLGAAASSAAGGLGSSMGGTSRGMSGSGTGNRTGSTAGGVQQPQFNQFGSVGNAIGQGSFVGRSDSSGRFVGQTQAGQQNAQGGMGLGRMGGGGRNGNGNNNNNNGNNFGGGGNQQAQQRRVRPQLKVAFPTPSVPTASIATTLQQRLVTHETLTAGSLKNVNLSMEEGGVVTLRGEVASQDAKSLAAAMVRLEPGVRKVVNELTVTQ